MEVRQLYYLHEIYHHKSYSRAANALHITQSNLSQQIRKLEDELGFKIFVHSRRSIVPTPNGERFLKDSKSVLEQWETLLTSTGQYSRFDKTNLIIGLFPSIKHTPVVALTDAYIKTHPIIVPEYRIMSEESVLDSLKNGTCHIGFMEDSYTVPNQGTISRKTKDNLIMTPICDDYIGIVLNVNDEMASSAVIRKKQLQNYRIICKKGGKKFTYERIRKIFLEEAVDIQRPYAMTDDLDIVSSILSHQSEKVFFSVNYSVGLSMVRNNPNLKCIPLESTKKVVSYMVMRREDEDVAAIRKYFDYIEKKINYIQT